MTMLESALPVAMREAGHVCEVGRQPTMNSTPVSLLESLRERPEAAGWQRFVQIYEPWLQGRLQTYGIAEADAACFPITRSSANSP